MKFKNVLSALLIIGSTASGALIAEEARMSCLILSEGSFSATHEMDNCYAVDTDLPHHEIEFLIVGGPESNFRVDWMNACNDDTSKSCIVYVSPSVLNEPTLIEAVIWDLSNGTSTTVRATSHSTIY